ncbi:hypothetical protein RvY_17775 [Ramazzottius varieornatus]|uniref:Uncharacterized protein n=1 Tax=Ramazzottius varieornatus TaxID=947166 RepID=A0A1D1W3C3_RAMVA|nr:hypothetical protein RvY_17775 [Ramazzottius varieornatus]
MISASTIQAEMFGRISAGQQPRKGISTLVSITKKSVGGDESLYLPSHHQDLFASYIKEKDRSEWLAYRLTDGAMYCYHCFDLWADHPQHESVRRKAWCNFFGVYANSSTPAADRQKVLRHEKTPTHTMCTERDTVMKETQFGDLWVVDETMRLELSKNYAPTVEVLDLVHTEAYSYLSYPSHAEFMNAGKRYGVDMGNSHMSR